MPSFVMFFHVSLILCSICSSWALEQVFWTWIDGSDTKDQKPMTSVSHIYPGSRLGTTSWLDNNGTTVWMFGGKGYGVEKSVPLPARELDELWSFEIESREWNWVNSSGEKPPPCFGCVSCQYKDQVVLFGAMPLTYIFNMVEKHWTSHNQTVSPAPRSEAAYWCDKENGMLWICGGLASREKLGDLWQFSFADMKWKEIKQMSNKSLVPVKCSSALAWFHPSGLLYMFGGSCLSGLTANFWVFTPATSLWTKLSTTAHTDKCAGQYGEKGVASRENNPGCRESSATWVDDHGDLWLFGGSGFDNYSTIGFQVPGVLSDLWKYDTRTKLWVWIGGLSREEGVPFYGSKGKQDLRNLPGPREAAVSFHYGGKLWLFGGGGHDIKGHDGLLNDLWVFEKLETATPTSTVGLQGDTIKISFGYRVLIALVVMSLGLVVTLSLCYSKECKIFRFRRRFCTVIKYRPVKVEMMQVQQPEIPLAQEANRNL